MTLNFRIPFLGGDHLRSTVYLERKANKLVREFLDPFGLYPTHWTTVQRRHNCLTLSLIVSDPERSET